MAIDNRAFNLKDYATKRDMIRALVTSTLAFMFCFSIWTIFSIIGIKIKYELNLTDTEFGFLIATPVLTGALSRLFLGVLSDQYGGRLVFTFLMMIASICTWFLAFADTYLQCIIIALGIGLSGGSFAVGVSYVSKWYSRERQGTALGVFGMGNFGAAITNFATPFLLYMGWQNVVKLYSYILFVVAILFFFFSKDDPTILHRRRFRLKFESTSKQLEPLKKLQVWRFALYYFFVFGSAVALSLWLPRYYVGVYGLDIKMAGILTALFSLPASLFRVLGGIWSDKVGARKILYITFIFSGICLFIMSYPATTYIIQGVSNDISFGLRISLIPFVVLTMILGFFMSLGMAAVYKHIPIYYPMNVGAVGGMVGLIGGLGGFFFPIIFGLLNDLIGIWTSCFMFLFCLCVVSLICMHLAIIYSLKK
ncbi:MAG TPA: MFS transporter [Candidatus Azoamicus sp.]